MGKQGRSVASVTPAVVLLLVCVLLVTGAAAYAGLGGSLRFHSRWHEPQLDFVAVDPSFAHADQVLTPDADPSAINSAAVQTALNGLMGAADLGTLGAAIVDVETGETVLDRAGSQVLAPASTTKVITAAAALTTFKATDRLATRVVAGSHPGEIVLIGGGDITLSADADGFYSGAASMVMLAQLVARARGDRPITKITVDSSLFTGATTHPSWDSDSVSAGYAAPITAVMVDGGRIADATARSSEPDLAAGQALANALGIDGAEVTIGPAPANATELARVQSPPIPTLVQWMLRDSDNVLAEALGRLVAIARHESADFAGAGDALAASMADLGISGQVALADASGLSRENLLAPVALTQVLTVAAKPQSALAPLFDGLPVGHFAGTLSDRFAGETAAGAGTVRAKTGTLQGVAALAGTIYTADGSLLTFALLSNGGNDATVRDALDRIAATLAACGC